MTGSVGTGWAATGFGRKGLSAGTGSARLRLRPPRLRSHGTRRARGSASTGIGRPGPAGNGLGRHGLGAATGWVGTVLVASAGSADRAAGFGARTGRGWRGAGRAGRRERRTAGADDERLEERQLQLEAEPAGAERVGSIARRAAGRRWSCQGRRAVASAREEPLAQGVDHLVQERPEVAAALLEPIEQRDAGGGVAGGERVAEAVDQLGVGQAKEVADRVGLDPAAVDDSSWSRIDSASRIPPAASRATTSIASGLGLAPVGRRGSARACR